MEQTTHPLAGITAGNLLTNYKQADGSIERRFDYQKLEKHLPELSDDAKFILVNITLRTTRGDWASYYKLEDDDTLVGLGWTKLECVLDTIAHVMTRQYHLFQEVKSANHYADITTVDKKHICWHSREAWQQEIHWQTLHGLFTVKLWKVKEGDVWCGVEPATEQDIATDKVFTKRKDAEAYGRDLKKMRSLRRQRDELSNQLSEMLANIDSYYDVLMESQSKCLPL